MGPPLTEPEARAKAWSANPPFTLSLPSAWLPSPSLLFLDHVKIKNKPGKNGSIHKARKISLALLSDKYLPSFLDKYCEREPETET